MAITVKSVEPYFANPASLSQDGTTYAQNFKVEFNISNATKGDRQLIEAKALFAAGIPRYGDVFKANKAAFCRTVSAAIIPAQSKNLPSIVLVSCTFTTVSVEKKDEETNPLDKAPDITWSTHFENEAIVNAISLVVAGQNIGAGGAGGQINNNKVPIINSAGQPFDPAPTRQVPYLKCSIVQNLPFFDIRQANSFIQTTNSSPFRLDGFLIKKGACLLLERAASIEYQGQFSFRKVQTSLLFKDNHDLHLQDRGTKVFNPKPQPSQNFNGGDPEKRIFIMDDGGENTAEDLLDGKGNRLEKGANAVYLEYTILSENDFNQLKLPKLRL